MSKVIASQIPISVPESKITEFFSFCGKIKNLEVVDKTEKTKTIEVEFEKSSAVSTALLLNGAEFEGNQIEVNEPVGQNSITSNNNETSTKDSKDKEANDSDIDQESKPKSAVIAELLANGYVLQSSLVDKAVEFDQKNGISERFRNFISGLDNKYHLQEKNKQIVDEANNRLGQVYDQANSQWNLEGYWNSGVRTWNSYLDKFKNDKYGSKVHDFYTKAATDAKAVNDEALRLAELKKQEISGETKNAKDSNTTDTPIPTINTITPESTTANAAAFVPLETSSNEKK